MSCNLENLKNEIKDFFIGYGKIDRVALKIFSKKKDWKIKAKIKIEDRHLSYIINNLYPETVTAIINGDLNMAALASELK